MRWRCGNGIFFLTPIAYKTMSDLRYTKEDLTAAVNNAISPLVDLIKQIDAKLTAQSGAVSDMMSVSELALYLGKEKATIYAWNNMGKGPKQCGHCLWRRTDVDEWLKGSEDRRARNCNRQKLRNKALAGNDALARAMQKKIKSEHKDF